MQKILSNKLSLFILTILLWRNAAFAQPQDDPGGISNDPSQQPAAAAPIDNWIPLMLILGITIVFFYTYKNKSIVN